MLNFAFLLLFIWNNNNSMRIFELTIKANIMNTIDNTIGKKVNANEVIALNVSHENGESHVYYGATKREANRNLKNNYPYFTKNIVSKEWNIELK